MTELDYEEIDLHDKMTRNHTYVADEANPDLEGKNWLLTFFMRSCSHSQLAWKLQGCPQFSVPMLTSVKKKERALNVAHKEIPWILIMFNG